MDVEAYLERIGIDPRTVGAPDLETLERLQRAHVTSVAFENLSIVGDPHGDREGEGVVLEPPVLYEKVVERDRGGYCFELNGLFHRLLGELGYDADRVAARVVGNGSGGVPANHHSIVVHLDRRYVVDVGFGTPIRVPLPIDGPSRPDGTGAEWRVARIDRPDVQYRVESRDPGEWSWTARYVFDPTPRELGYFEATCDYLQSAPESPFTGEPVVVIATEDGSRKLSADALTETTPTGERERGVPAEDWHATLREEFGIRYDPE